MSQVAEPTVHRQFDWLARQRRRESLLSFFTHDEISRIEAARARVDPAQSTIAYEVSPETLRGAEEDLTAEGLAALDRRTGSIAGLMHLVLLRYRDLRVGNAETGGRPGPRFAAMAAMAAPVAEPGEATIRVTIEAELLLAAPRP